MILAWMGYAVLIAAFIAAAAMAVEWALRAYRSPTRWLWVAAIVLSVLGPLAGLRAGSASGISETQTESLVLGEAAESNPYLTMPAAVLTLDDPSRFSRFDRPLLLAWLLASMLLAVRYGASLALLSWRRRGWRTDDIDGITVRIAPDLGPAVIGFLAPVIVLPGWIRALDERLLRLVVAHEQEHVRKGDSRLLIAAGVVVVLLPWNLPLWWQIRRLRLAVEIDCDGRVLAGTAEIAPYAGLLCEIGTMRGRSLVDSIALGQSALIRPAAFLERRIRHMTASVPRHRRWKALGVGTVAITVLGFATLPDPPPAPAGEAQQEYHLLLADIEYRNAQSVAALPSVYVVVPSQLGQPERRWLETYESYEDMTIVDRQIITREEVCYTTREPDDSMRMRTRSTVPEIDSLMRIPDDTGAAARFLSEQNGGKEVKYMTFTVQERAVCFLLRGETNALNSAEMEPAPPSDDAEGTGSRDTIDFEFTPFAEHPVCEEVCSAAEIRPFFTSRVGEAACSVVIGILIDATGRVDQVDILEPGAIAGCEEAAEVWARSTGWSPARNASGEPISVWIAQPVAYTPQES